MSLDDRTGADEDYHQLGADITIPSSANLIETVLNLEQICHLIEAVGLSELQRITSVNHSHDDLRNIPFGDPRWESVFQAEGRDLNILRSAIKGALGVERPWINGYASDFARTLLKYVN